MLFVACVCGEVLVLALWLCLTCDETDMLGTMSKLVMMNVTDQDLKCFQSALRRWARAFMLGLWGPAFLAGLSQGRWGLGAKVTLRRDYAWGGR